MCNASGLSEGFGDGRFMIDYLARDFFSIEAVLAAVERVMNERLKLAGK